MAEAMQDRLKNLGFKHDQFSDGAFWYICPDNKQTKTWLAKAIGGEDAVWDGPPDDVILQVSDDMANWSYVCGNNAGQLDIIDALQILKTLEQTKKV